MTASDPPTAATPPRPRVLLADDDAKLRIAIARFLSSSCDVVGWAADSLTLFDLVEQLRPDVVLLDFSLPGGLTAIEVCRRLKTVAPDVGLVAFTAHDDPEIRRLTLEAGASAFVWKFRASDDLLSTIQAVFERRRGEDADGQPNRDEIGR